MEQHLFPNEKIIQQSGNGLVTLTTHRVRLSASSMGSADVLSIMLHRVSSISVRYSSKPFLLVLFVIGLIATGYFFSEDQEEMGMISLSLAAVGIAAYLFLRKHFVAIASCGGAPLMFHTSGMSKERILDFINEVEKAIENHRNNTI